MFEKTIFNYKELEIKVSDFANEKILGLLNSTVLGSEGGMRYALQNIASRIEDYKGKIRFVTLYKKNQVTGTIGACYRESVSCGNTHLCSYIRYLAVQSGYQAYAGVKKFRRRTEEKPDRDDNFKRKTLDIFSKPWQLDIEGASETEKHIMYAYVESMNERSKNLVNQAGYEQIRSFLTVAFSRFSPKEFPSVTKLEESERTGMKATLAAYYRNHTLYTDDFAFLGNSYYVLREGNEIIAGVSAHPSRYKVHHVPGIWGWVFMKILPKLPYYRRLFQPGEFRYLVFDSLYCREGQEDKLVELFESVCASEGYNTALTWVDDRSHLYEVFRTSPHMGAINRMLNAKPGIVFARFINFTEKEKEIFFENPVYITGVDIS